MDDLLSFLRTSELGIVALVAAGLCLSFARLFPDLKRKSGYGIVAFELPRSADRARAIVAAWKTAGLLSAARRSIKVDQWFIPMYVVLLACAGVLVARAGAALGGLGDGSAETVALLLVVGAVVAGVLDVLENAGMKLMLDGRMASPIPLATTVVSALKWALLLALVVSFAAVLLAGLLG